MRILLIPSSIRVSENFRKCVYNCSKCKKQLTHRIHRGWIFSVLLSFLPFKKYACLRCMRRYYVYTGKNPFRATKYESAFNINDVQLDLGDRKI